MYIYKHEMHVLNGWKSYFQSLLTGDTQKEIEQKYGEEEDMEIEENKNGDRKNTCN
jgi:phosphoribosyl-ATP pyrophosphohydrolase